MTNAQLAALLGFFTSVGAVAGISGSALLREAPGAKAYFVHQYEVKQAVNPDAGNSLVSATAFATSTLALSDGGTSVVDLGGTPCPLTGVRQDSLRAILVASTVCAQQSMNTDAVLLRETPGAKTYLVDKFEVRNTLLEDAGTTVAVTAYTTATLTLGDGGTAVIPLGGVPCPLSAARTTTMKTILAAAQACGQNAP